MEGGGIMMITSGEASFTAKQVLMGEEHKKTSQYCTPQCTRACMGYIDTYVLRAPRRCSSIVERRLGERGKPTPQREMSSRETPHLPLRTPHRAVLSSKRANAFPAMYSFTPLSPKNANLMMTPSLCYLVLGGTSNSISNNTWGVLRKLSNVLNIGRDKQFL